MFERARDHALDARMPGVVALGRNRHRTEDPRRGVRQRHPHRRARCRSIPACNGIGRLDLDHLELT